MNDFDAEKLRKQLSALGFQMSRQYKEIMHKLNEQHEVMIRNIQELRKEIKGLQ